MQFVYHVAYRRRKGGRTGILSHIATVLVVVVVVVVVVESVLGVEFKFTWIDCNASLSL